MLLPWRRRRAGVQPHVHKWALDAGAYLGRAFAEVEHVGTRLERRRIGPHVVLFDFLPVPPSRASIQKLLKAGPLVKATIHVDRVHIHEERGRIIVRVPNPYAEPIDPLAFEGGADMAVPVGLSDRGGVDVLDFERTPHVGIFGPTNAGKTTIARMIVLHLARQNDTSALRLFVIGADASDWRAVESLPHSWGFVHHADAPRALDWLVAETDRRQRAGIRSPRIVALIDDAVELVGAHPTIGAAMKRLSSQARHAGIHLVIISQVATKAGTGDTTALANTPRRFVVGAATATDAARLTGRSDTGAHELGIGEALSVGAGPVAVVAIPNVTPDMLYGFSGVRQRAPWERDDALAAPPLIIGRDPLVQEPMDERADDPRILSFGAKRATSKRSGSANDAESAQNGPETSSTSATSTASQPLRAASTTSSIEPQELEVLRRVKAGEGLRSAIIAVYGVEGGTEYQKATKRITGHIARLLPDLEGNDG